jgi:hypothetical protein
MNLIFVILICFIYIVTKIIKLYMKKIFNNRTYKTDISKNISNNNITKNIICNLCNSNINNKKNVIFCEDCYQYYHIICRNEYLLLSSNICICGFRINKLKF